MGQVFISNCQLHSITVPLPTPNMYVPPLFCGMHMCHGLNSHYFHIIGDGHQPDSRGLYAHYKDSY